MDAPPERDRAPPERVEISQDFASAEPENGPLSSDGRALLLRDVEQVTAMIRQFTACFTDPREDASLHGFRQRFPPLDHFGQVRGRIWVAVGSTRGTFRVVPGRFPSRCMLPRIGGGSAQSKTRSGLSRLGSRVVVSSGGGTRTPDTRIMIPLL